MDKITRMLFLYQRLMRGEVIDKTRYTMKFGVTERSFDRDVQTFRNFLSETYSHLELIYDPDSYGYRLKNLQIKHEIQCGECYILIKLLLDSKPLHTGDQAGIVEILLSQLSPEMRERIMPVLAHTPSIPDCFEKASVKMVGDLLFSIERKDQILLQFEPRVHEILCVPYSVEISGGNIYLVAWEMETNQPTLYHLDDFNSYLRQKQPYVLNLREQKELQKLVELVCAGDREAYRIYLHRKGEENDEL